MTVWRQLGMLLTWLIAARLVPRGASLGRKCVLSLVFLTAFASQGLAIVRVYQNTQFYKPHETMSLSDFLVHEDLNSRMFSGKNVLPILVADYMPRAQVFLYAADLYPKEVLAWSGRDLTTTFVVGGYRSTLDGPLRAACLARAHIIYKGLYIATPLSIYEAESQVFLMTDTVIDYLIPGSWSMARGE
jgi:hypothetical protein